MKVIKRSIAVWWALFLAFLGATEKQPNIIIFLVDDMGVMDTSVSFFPKKGSSEVLAQESWFQTPSIEALAESGVRFNQFCAHSVCSPSRISLLTGQNSARHRSTNWIHPLKNNRGKYGPKEWQWKGIDAGVKTLPSVLKSKGYRTIHVGKSHLGPVGSWAEDPRAIGFDVNVAGGAMGQPRSYYGEDHYGHHPKFTHGKNKVVTNRIPHLEKYHGSSHHLTEALTQEASVHVKDAVARRQPFFLHLSHYAVHSPFQADVRYLHNYEDRGRTDQEAAFASMVEGVDKSLGDIMSLLKELNIAEETLMIFLGDNGSDCPKGEMYDVGACAPLRGKKATQYEGGMRVPCIVSWAQPRTGHSLQGKLMVESGEIQEQLSSITDIYPTILDLLEIQVPEHHAVDGESLATLLMNPKDSSRRDSFLMHFPHDHRNFYFTSLRDQDWKVIYHYGLPSDRYTNKFKPEKYELYHLAKDPGEQHNLATDHPDQLKKMMEKMIKQLDSYQALYPTHEGMELRPMLP